VVSSRTNRATLDIFEGKAKLPRGGLLCQTMKAKSSLLNWKKALRGRKEKGLVQRVRTCEGSQ
jgi:hypothetical protein